MAQAAEDPSIGAGRTIDPVCGMTVDPSRAAATAEHHGKTYFFCSKGCAAKFSSDPERYLAGAREAVGPASMAVQDGHGAVHGAPVVLQRAPLQYACPMHPEVI